MPRLSPALLSLPLLIVLAGPLLSQSRLKDLPPKGIKTDPTKRTALKRSLDTQPASASADVRVFQRAVKLAVEQNLFYRKGDLDRAGELLTLASKREQDFRRGRRGLDLLGYRPEANDQVQLLVGGFESKIDRSVQPFGLVLPVGFDPQKRYRVDVWLHGRGDTKTEIPFLLERMTRPGTYTPRDTIVLHPFGRHCNAFKFAGETDVYEALEHLAGLVRVDRDRIAIRGFSMGGAGCWHLAAHNPTHWFAANPGAGFVDTLVYQGWTDATPFPINPTRKKLLRWYDVLPWTGNLKNIKVVAYNGELDKQRQSGQRVYDQAKRLGFDFPHIIGPKTKHKIAPESAAIITGMIDDIAANRPRRPRAEIDFTTYTLRYADAGWIKVTGMREHWEPARVQARLTDDNSAIIRTSGVTHLALHWTAFDRPSSSIPRTVVIDETTLRTGAEDSDPKAPPVASVLNLVKRDRWQVDTGDSDRLRKRPSMQGPIDDALTSKFIFVLPSRPARHGVVDRWIQRETQYAMQRWQEIMRGDVNVVRDVDVTPELIRQCNLICFGDFTGNQYLARIQNRLPFEWTDRQLRFAGKEYPAVTHAPVFCFPNPENPDRYVVVNSGLTFRKFSNNSNSRQIAMLPDWAVLDVAGDYDANLFPGKIVDQGFFNETWQQPRLDAQSVAP